MLLAPVCDVFISFVYCSLFFQPSFVSLASSASSLVFLTSPGDVCVNFCFEIFIYIQIPLALPVCFLSPRNEIVFLSRKPPLMDPFCAIDCYPFNSHLALGCSPIQTSRRTLRLGTRSIVPLQGGLDSSCQFRLVYSLSGRSIEVFFYIPLSCLSSYAAEYIVF